MSWPEKPQEFCRVEDDENAWHYGVYVELKLICVASIYPEVISNCSHSNKEKRAQLRKFATLVPYQKQGVGSFVLRHIIDSLKAEGQHFYKGDIPYFKMQMNIT